MKLQVPVKRTSVVLMICSIVLVVAFLAYWITRLYNDERNKLSTQSDVLFKDVVYRLQLQRFRADTMFFSKQVPDNLFLMDVIDSAKRMFNDSIHKPGISLQHENVVIRVMHGNKDSVTDANMHFIREDEDSAMLPKPGKPARIVRYLSQNKIINDSLSVRQLDSAYKIVLLKNNIYLPFIVQAVSGNNLKQTDGSDIQTSISYVGLKQNTGYRAVFENEVMYTLGKIKWQISFSILLVFITLLSFIFLYRTLVSQRRLALMKDEFISNITHELKTPIATVIVAIEALKNFNALDDPGRSKEYLDISAIELQRLSMLVDKVLRLSMFENQQIKLNKEYFDLYSLSVEIINVMKLQFEKANAVVSLHKQGEKFTMHADKVHISSLLYNLLDNALKYSNASPVIDVNIISHATFIELSIADNGIGIAPEYKGKIFEKFFRVPAHGHHETKGYGLGLSYVNHIAHLHLGFVEVQSEEGKGSTFSVKLPYEEADEIIFDRGRVIRKAI